MPLENSSMKKSYYKKREGIVKWIHKQANESFPGKLHLNRKYSTIWIIPFPYTQKLIVKWISPTIQGCIKYGVMQFTVHRQPKNNFHTSLLHKWEVKWNLNHIWEFFRLFDHWLCRFPYNITLASYFIQRTEKNDSMTCKCFI